MYTIIFRDGTSAPAYESIASFKNGTTRKLPFAFRHDALSSCELFRADEQCVTAHVMLGERTIQAWYRLGIGEWEQRA